MLNNEISGEDLTRKLIAGNATLTFTSRKTGEHYTFQIKLNGQKTEILVIHNAKIIGRIIDLKFFIYPEAVKYNKVQEVFAWIWKHSMQPDTLKKRIIIQHHGKCVRCGRPLTDPESLAVGVGPECRKYV